MNEIVSMTPRRNDLPKIGFIGSMNAMPMGYALDFLDEGFDVRYIVEAEIGDVLMRPECQYPAQVTRPYPEWIRELVRPYSLIGAAFAPIYYRKIVAEMADRDVVFLNDFGLSLAPYLKSASLVALSSGSDIDIYCSYKAALVASNQTRRWYWYPIRLGLELLRVWHQRRGLERCQVISYFPKGLNPIGDEIVEHFVRKGRARIIPRFDINLKTSLFEPSPIKLRPLKNILVPVRFNIHPPPQSSFEYKGNDLIIEALGRYVQRNPSVTIRFVRKGPQGDLEFAKRRIKQLGFEPNVLWFDQMPISQLVNLYEESDVCIDQVGSHWIGAVGVFALQMGRPLIANSRLEVFSKLWGTDSPILNATTSEEVFEQLVRCEDLEFRHDVSIRSSAFVLRELSSTNTYHLLRDAAIELHKQKTGK